MVAAEKGDASTIALQRHDVRLDDNNVRIHIYRSKTDQRSTGVTTTQKDIFQIHSSWAALVPLEGLVLDLIWVEVVQQVFESQAT